MIDVLAMDKVLNSVYLDVVSSCLNEKTSAFYKKITKTASNVFGKEIVAPCRFGINSGVACTAETAELPASGAQNLINFKAPLINIYGNIEISDKLLRLSDNGASAVDILNYEIDSLLDSAKFNLRRMLFQDGEGKLATVSTTSTGTSTISVDSTRNLIEGMVVDFLSGSTVLDSNYKIIYVDKKANTVKFDKTVPVTIVANSIMTLHGSYKCELFGLPYIFSDGGVNLYGNTRSIIKYALPSEFTDTAVNADVLQSVVDRMEEVGAEEPDMIIGSYAMRRKYISAMNTAHLNVETVYDGEFKAPGFNGIPIYAEPFIGEDVMYFINTKDFFMGQLADWSWVEGSTHDILRPIPGKASYSATLVKYCNLICRRPKGQAILTLTTSED